MPRRPLLSLLLATLALPAWADSVVTSEQVSSRVVLRADASRTSRDVGSLRPGEQALHLDTRSGWHRVRLDDGTEGWVSARWTEIHAIPEEPVDVAAMKRPRRPLLAAIGSFLRGLWPGRSPLELEVHEPSTGSRYRHDEARLPVSGFARAKGAGRLFDLLVTIDASTSTNEFSRADVDLDGLAEDAWMGRDSIYRAQLSAAANLVRALDRLPGNEDGQRVRVGLVVYGGDERYRLYPADRDLDLDQETLRSLGLRDARVALPLTSDYVTVVRSLEKLWHETPIGMTNVAAGIGRAVLELTAAPGAASTRREGAEKLVLFLSDGKPRLPYDWHVAERAAMVAGRLAADAGVRINAFGLGYDEVTRKRDNYSLRRMAHRTGGRYVALDRPGEIVTSLANTSFAVVDRVRLRNRTTGEGAGEVATGIDGSFYGEVPLVEGENEIEVTAWLDDGRRARRVFEVEYVHGRPARELEAELARLRAENEALVERIRGELAEEMREAHARQRQSQRQRLELHVEPDQRRRLELQVEPGDG